MTNASRPLADLLSLLRPSARDTTLLCACLLDDERGRAALRSWSQSGPPADLLRPRCNRLFPLLAEAVRRSDLTLDPTVRSLLRAALASEEVRYEAYLRVFGPLLTAMVEDGIDPIVLKGAALAETVYPRPQLRHTHDIDLLIAPHQHSQAIASAQRCGWRPGAARDSFIHSSGLPLGLHTRVVRASFAPADFQALRQRTKTIPLAGLPLETLGPADALVHILGQALTSGTFFSLQWACDAILSVAHGEIDWELFTTEVTRGRLSWAYAEMLRYLRNDIGAAVPAEVVAAIENNAAGSARDQEAVIASMDAGAFRMGTMWERASTWPTRLALLKWMFLPGSTAAHAAAPDVPYWQLPLRSLRRGALGLIRRTQRQRAGSAHD